MNPEFVYAIGDFITATFELLPMLGNLPNILFTLIIAAGLAYWLRELTKYKAEAKQSGRIE